jgi:hypothetical protein
MRRALSEKSTAWTLKPRRASRTEWAQLPQPTSRKVAPGGAASTRATWSKACSKNLSLSGVR